MTWSNLIKRPTLVQTSVVHVYGFKHTLGVSVNSKLICTLYKCKICHPHICKCEYLTLDLV